MLYNKNHTAKDSLNAQVTNYELYLQIFCFLFAQHGLQCNVVDALLQGLCIESLHNVHII